jgi:hypothetical protein
VKTLRTALFVAALALTGTAQGQETGKTAGKEPVKTAAKKVTTEDVGLVLEQMGYELQPNKDKDGKLKGYWFDLTRGGTTITLYVNVSPGGTVVWLDNNLITFDEKTPATTETLLGLLAEQDNLWPAYLTYYPKTKMLTLALPVEKALTPANIRAALDSFADKFQIVADAYKKVTASEAAAKEKVATKD